MRVGFIFAIFMLWLHAGDAKREKRTTRHPEDDSVCFNDCSGHGECVQYTCLCHPGHYGDDCSVAFSKENDEGVMVNVLGAGHFNISSKQELWDAIGKENSITVVGFTSRNCHRCIVVENEYDLISKKLTKMNEKVESLSLSQDKANIKLPTIQFARVDIEDSVSMRAIAQEYKATEIPSLVVFQNWNPKGLSKSKSKSSKNKKNKQARGLLFQGAHNYPSVVQYLQKLTSPAAVPLGSISDVQGFLHHQRVPPPQEQVKNSKSSKSDNRLLSKDVAVAMHALWQTTGDNNNNNNKTDNNNIDGTAYTDKDKDTDTDTDIDEYTPDPATIGAIGSGTSIARTSVIAFFSSHKNMEEDEYEEFLELAERLSTREDMYVLVLIMLIMLIMLVY